MYLTRTPYLLIAGLCLACQADNYAVMNPFAEEPSPAVRAPQEDPNGWSSGVTATDETLYGWDGAPVGSPVLSSEPGGIQVTDGGLAHSLEGADMSGGSRMVLLELYQQSVEEREGLALQVEAQDAALEMAERRYLDMAQRLSDLEASYGQLFAEKTAVEQEAQALAARLTTAQIRRLEAEKVWLQTAIEWREQAGVDAPMRAQTASGQTGGSSQ